MYCPQCATESSPGLQYCRACGANLKVIGKAVALSEAIARSDRGPLPKIKEMIKGLKVEHVTEEVSRALEKMNNEIAKMSPESRAQRQPWNFRKKKTPQERRDDQIVKGTVSLFSGIGLTIFLYYLSASLVLRIPPDVVAKIPFEIESAVRVIWLIGLIPILSGLGHIIAGLLIRPNAPLSLDPVAFPPNNISENPSLPDVPGSISERTTDLLEREPVRENSAR